jgi:hypothetical protein
MKKTGITHALLLPDARGWRLRLGTGEDRILPTLGEAMAGVPATAHLELALPCQAVLLERHKLPATDRTELADMLNLQLEKTLPFPVEEVSHGFEVLGQEENESTILSVTAHHAQLDRICAPLRDAGRIPERISLLAQRIAAACPADETTLALWPEQEQLVAAIVNHGQLVWAQPLSSLDANTVLDELPGLLLSAELDGVPTTFSHIRLAQGCSDLEPVLVEHFGKQVLPLADTSEAQAGLDLLPASWQHAAHSRERGEKLKQNLLLAAVIYLLLVAGAFIYLAVMKRKVQTVLAEVAAVKPRYDGMAKQQSRWDALAPTVEPGRFAAEVMYLLHKNWEKSAALQFTSFTFSPREWIVKGEGTSDAHFEFVQRLKQEKELNGFDVAYPGYTPLKDDKVSYSITGKPR